MSMIPSFFGRQSNTLGPFSVDVYDRFDCFPFGTALTSSFPRPSDLSNEVSAFTGAWINWKETPEAQAFKADLPGLKKEEVKVEVEDGKVLQISSERNKEDEEKNDKWDHVERSSGKFMSPFRLPENVKVDQVKVAMENGVLTITVPKEEPRSLR